MTCVLALECALSSLTSVFVHSRRAARLLFPAFLTLNLLAPYLIRQCSNTLIGRDNSHATPTVPVYANSQMLAIQLR
jgi:hypothetical protein